MTEVNAWKAIPGYEGKYEANWGGITDQEMPVIVLDVGKPEPMEGAEE